MEAEIRKVIPKPKQHLFPLGQLVVTPGIQDAFTANGTTGMEYVNRHCQGDWGDLGKEDKQTNYEAVKKGERIFSAYALPDKTVIWIITERDRSVTTILLPSEY